MQQTKRFIYLELFNFYTCTILLHITLRLQQEFFFILSVSIIFLLSLPFPPESRQPFNILALSRFRQTVVRVHSFPGWRSVPKCFPELLLFPGRGRENCLLRPVAAELRPELQTNQGGFDGRGQPKASPMLTAIMSGGVGISGRELYKYR